MVDFGGDYLKNKQNPLMFNIWKYSILQRDNDEILFSCFVNLPILLLTSLQATYQRQFYQNMDDWFGDSFVKHTYLLFSDPQAQAHCETMSQNFGLQYDRAIQLFVLLLLWTIGNLVSLLQKIFTAKVKNNVSLEFNSILLLFISGASGILFLAAENITSRSSPSLETDLNWIVSDFCEQHVSLSEDQKFKIAYQYTLMHPLKSQIDIALVKSLIVILCCV